MGITTNLAVNADPAVTDTSFKEDLSKSYSLTVWRQLRRSPLGLLGIAVLALFVVIAIYAPILASSKPLVVNYDGIWYFPLWRYLFYSGFYTKYLDLFFNLMMFTMPLALLATWRWYHDSKSYGSVMVWWRYCKYLASVCCL
jgi:peptide/nickel transport system permease protein